MQPILGRGRERCLAHLGVTAPLKRGAASARGSSLRERVDNSDPAVRAIYDRRPLRVRRLGPTVVEENKTSIHLTSGAAFAGGTR